MSEIDSTQNVVLTREQVMNMAVQSAETRCAVLREQLRVLTDENRKINSQLKIALGALQLYSKGPYSTESVKAVVEICKNFASNTIREIEEVE